MSDADDLRDAGERMERLLGQLRSLADQRAIGWAEDLVRVVTDLYGAGLARVVEIGCQPDGAQGPALHDALAGDELVSSLLMLHGLHPVGVARRVEQAVQSLRPALGSAEVRVVSVDEQSAAVRLQLVVPPGAEATSAFERMLREAVEAAAPEIIEVEIDRVLPATPVHLVAGPRARREAAPVAASPPDLRAAR